MSSRLHLAQSNGQRMRWTARVGRRGKMTRGHETMVLLDVRRFEDNQPMTDHLRIRVGKWNRLLKPGQRIAFDARIDSYTKGYARDRRTGYHLEFPTKVCVQDRDGQWQPAPKPTVTQRTRKRVPAKTAIAAPATPVQLIRLAALRGCPGNVILNQPMNRAEADDEIAILAAIRNRCAGTTRAGNPCINVIRGCNKFCPSHLPTSAGLSAASPQTAPPALTGKPDTKSPRPAYEGPAGDLGEVHTRTMQPGVHTALHRKITIRASTKTGGRSKT